MMTKDMPNVGLRAEDFLLSADAFVERCFEVFGEGIVDLKPTDLTVFSNAIRSGRTRLEVADAIKRRLIPLQSREKWLVDSVGVTFDSFVVVEELEKYAPGDDNAFVNQLYEQLMGRNPSSIERLEAIFDLKGRRSRADLICDVAARSPAVHLSNSHVPRGVGAIFNARGQSCFRLIGLCGSAEWLTADGVVLSNVKAVDGGFEVSPGWILTGPKRTFSPGLWRCSIDLIQHEDAQLVVDVVCSGGLDVLAKCWISGSACFSVIVKVEPWHKFLEVRLLKPDLVEPNNALKIRDISMRQL